jgi:hypothetical protein
LAAQRVCTDHIFVGHQETARKPGENRGPFQKWTVYQFLVGLTFFKRLRQSNIHWEKLKLKNKIVIMKFKQTS